MDDSTALSQEGVETRKTLAFVVVADDEGFLHGSEYLVDESHEDGRNSPLEERLRFEANSEDR